MSRAEEPPSTRESVAAEDEHGGRHPSRTVGERTSRTRKKRSERIAQKTVVKIGSLNMNGFGVLTADYLNNKWGKVYRVMMETRTTILLMQETHLTLQRVNKIHEMYSDRLKIFYSKHESAPTQKEGVAVVINKKLMAMQGATARTIVAGRAIQLQIMWRGGEKRNILCVYAPTSDGVSERAAFFREVAAFYTRNPDVPKPDLMAGDFNNVEDTIDRSPVPETTQEASVAALDKLKHQLGMTMTDGWRITNPTTKNYTFQRGVGKARTMARLDRIYAAADQMKWARDWTIEQVGLRTDHCLVTVTLTTPSAPEAGKGRPIFPLHLLKDKVLARKMKTHGREAVKQLREVMAAGRTEDKNPQTILYSLKQDWLAMARKREKEITPKIMREIKDLEDRHNSLQKGSPEGSNGEEEMGLIVDQLKALKEKRHSQLQAKARAKHRVDGERPTKYWVNLQREREPREMIVAFEIPETGLRGAPKQYTSDPKVMAEMARRHYNGVQDGGPHNDPTERERAIEEALRSLDSKVSSEQEEMMGKDIMRDEVDMALRFTKTGTAPGLDGIQYEVWKTVHARYVEDRRHEGRETLDIIELLTEMYRDMSTNGVCKKVPFAEGWIAPIYKEKGERTRVENYRPITLLNTDYKLLSKILALRL
ncbi:Endonuclease/exonuclease/phosphatase, partial [Lenzites betulinus]